MRRPGQRGAFEHLVRETLPLLALHGIEAIDVASGLLKEGSRALPEDASGPCSSRDLVRLPAPGVRMRWLAAGGPPRTDRR